VKVNNTGMHLSGTFLAIVSTTYLGTRKRLNKKMAARRKAFTEPIIRGISLWEML
jgi:hypothetical protein